MKKLLTILLSISFLQSFGQIEETITIPGVLANVYDTTDGTKSINALLLKPDDYASTTTRYALIIFGHGTGQAGTNLATIYNNPDGGPAYQIEHSSFTNSFVNPADGLTYKFLIVTPQNSSWSVYARQMLTVVQYMVNNYRVDTNRIYVTGLSAGGESTLGYASAYDNEVGAAFSKRYLPAASVPMSPAGLSPSQLTNMETRSLQDSVPTWAFGSVPPLGSDGLGGNARDYAAYLNSAVTGYGRFTNYSGGHCCWAQFYTPGYTEVIGGQTMNIYQWMLTHKRNSGAIATRFNYYFSNSGNDSRTPTQAQNPATPWKTIAKLNSYLSSINPGDSILFNRGETFPGTIKINKSGTTIPMIIGAYGTGSLPVISGFATLTGWINKGGGVWESGTTLGNTVRIVAINSVPYAMGRYPNADAPNKGWLKFESHNSNVSITDNELPSSPNWTNATLVLRKKRFIIETGTITNHSGNTLAATTGSSDPLNNFGYFIQNDIRTLDEFGEWYYNTVTHKLSINFGDALPTDFVVEANIFDTGISIRNQNRVSVSYLAFRGQGLFGADIYTTAYTDVKNCDFNLIGRDGIKVAVSSNVTVSGVTTNNCQDIGINLVYPVTNSQVLNCKIQNTGLFAGMGDNNGNAFSGLIALGTGITVKNNDVINSGFAGIEFYENNVTIENNYVDTYGVTADDIGGIYSGGGLDTTVVFFNRKIKGNVVLNGIGSPEGTTSTTPLTGGIYLDNNCNNVAISNNIVSNHYFGIYLHNSKNVSVTNNTSYNNYLYDLHMLYNVPSALRHDTVRNNIFFAKKLTEKTANFQTVQDDIKYFGLIDSNYYPRPIDDNLVIQTIIYYGLTGQQVTQRNLGSWQSYSNFDAHSFKSPNTVNDTSKIKFYFNPTSLQKSQTIVGNMIDAKGVGYSGNATIPAYYALVLMPAATVKTTPVITWPTPASVTLGTVISSTQNNASASVAGVHSYSPANGFVTNAPGNLTLNDTFTPTDTANYLVITKTVTLLVTLPSTGTRKNIPVAGDGGIYWFNTGASHLNPGDTGCIPAGTYPYIQLNNIIGTASQPITIINCGGQVVVTGSNGTGYCVLIKNSRFIKFTGTGDAGFKYGFKAAYFNGTEYRHTGVMMSVRDSCTDYEIDHMEGDSVNNGFLCKIDPSSDNPASWRGNWVIRNVKIHDNYVNYCTGEVIYFVNTDQYTVVQKNGVDTTVLPVPSDNAEIYNNDFRHAGWDGIQCASSTNLRIHDNYIYDYGTLDISSQQAGIIMGGRSNGSVYNNIVTKGTGNGFEYYGWDKNILGVSSGLVGLFYNNIADSCGSSLNVNQFGIRQIQDGFYFDGRPAQSNNLVAYIMNNTIINPYRYGVSTFNSNPQGNGSKINNNLIVHPGSAYINIPTSGLIVDTTFNQRIATIAAANFVDYTNKNFAITNTSPAFDAGKDLSPYLTTDIIGTTRPQNLAYDIGAYEFVSGGTRITPVISWMIPDKVYNTLIQSSDLQPTSGGIAGTYTFSGIALGQKFAAGPHTVSVLFVPTDKTMYNNATGTATFTVTPQLLTGTFVNLTQTFNNTPLKPGIVTSPVAGVAVNITLNGTGAGQVNAGTYSAVGGSADPNYSMPVFSGTFTITKALDTIRIQDTTQYYDGNPKPISTFTSHGGTVNVTYTGGNVTQGDHAFTATYTATNYQAVTKTGTLHILANTAIIRITNYSNRVYTASPIVPTVTSAYPYTLSYLPTNHTDVNNNIRVIATITDGVHTGADTVIMSIIPAPYTLNWPIPAPIRSGSALSTAQLNPTSSIAGYFTFNYPVGTILPEGTTVFVGTFHPTDTNYPSQQVSTTISVFGNPLQPYYIINGQVFYLNLPNQ